MSASASGGPSKPYPTRMNILATGALLRHHHDLHPGYLRPSFVANNFTAGSQSLSNVISLDSGGLRACVCHRKRRQRPASSHPLPVTDKPRESGHRPLYRRRGPAGRAGSHPACQRQHRHCLEGGAGRQQSKALADVAIVHENASDTWCVRFEPKPVRLPAGRAPSSTVAPHHNNLTELGHTVIYIDQPDQALPGRGQGLRPGPRGTPSGQRDQLPRGLIAAPRLTY